MSEEGSNKILRFVGKEDESERTEEGGVQIHLHYELSLSSKMTKTDDSGKSTIDRLQRYDEFIKESLFLCVHKNSV